MRPSSTGLYRSSRRRRARRIEVYLPDMPGPHPAVVLVHGGLLPLASRNGTAIRHLRQVLIDAGHAVVGFDHRSPVLDFAAALDDTRAALAWVAEQAPSFDLDPARISVVGLSSGAALATLAADRPHRLVGIYGPYDFTRLPLGWLGSTLLLRRVDPAQLAWRSPANACGTQSPLLLLHGTHDRVVPVAHAEQMVASREARGLPVRLRLFPGAGHGFLDHAGLNVWDEAAGELLAFLLEPGPDRTGSAHK